MSITEQDPSWDEIVPGDSIGADPIQDEVDAIDAAEDAQADATEAWMEPTGEPVATPDTEPVDGDELGEYNEPEAEALGGLDYPADAAEVPEAAEPIRPALPEPEPEPAPAPVATKPVKKEVGTTRDLVQMQATLKQGRENITAWVDLGEVDVKSGGQRVAVTRMMELKGLESGSFRAIAETSARVHTPKVDRRILWS